jgi:hypothetical protein
LEIEERTFFLLEFKNRTTDFWTAAKLGALSCRFHWLQQEVSLWYCRAGFTDYSRKFPVVLSCRFHWLQQEVSLWYCRAGFTDYSRKYPCGIVVHVSLTTAGSFPVLLSCRFHWLQQEVSLWKTYSEVAFRHRRQRLMWKEKMRKDVVCLPR